MDYMRSDGSFQSWSTGTTNDVARTLFYDMSNRLVCATSVAGSITTRKALLGTELRLRDSSPARLRLSDAAVAFRRGRLGR